MTYYNLAIDIKQQKCVVVGGGRIALRKAKKLCIAGAKVTVVSPDFLPEFHSETVPSDIQLCHQTYSSEVLTGAVLVFAATSMPETNRQVCSDAQNLGIWFNSVNGTRHSSFIIPASCQKEILTIGITTDGKAPVLSKHLRQYFEEILEKIPEKALIEIVELRAKKVKTKNEKTKMDLEHKINEKANNIIKQLKNK